MRNSAPIILAVAALALTTTACATGRDGGNSGPRESRANESEGGIGISLPFLGSGNREVANGGIGVNSFLWRATLDTLSFMPMASADPFGGTYVTEWQASPERPQERFKIQVYILDTRLRADGISVQVFRQVQGLGGQWIDASVDPDTPLQVENAILTRARQLRISTLESDR
jgi:hypothetical protein